MPIRRSMNEKQGSGGMDEDDEFQQVEMAPCSICGRNFAVDRLAKHEQICQKAGAKKRPVYNATAARLEKEALNIFKANQAAEAKQHTKKEPPKRSMPKWKVEHESFLNAVRAANNSRGGEIAPDPSLVLCPHCGRRFNESAAERHIPRCTSLGTKPVCPDIQKRKPMRLNNNVSTKVGPAAATSTKQTPSASPVMPGGLGRGVNTRTTPAGPAAGRAAGPAQRGGRVGVFAAAGNDLLEKVPCPHCGRSFEKHAALRHIEVCAKVVNKPRQLVRR
eukprot:TRINITY_DN2743_c0_g1_i1.p1 TRINITY_DN2743_c0_g1~~TRINITY_DN2743_c0_g1_i1.p1  ORF type:complete len:276 (+),score=57.81 TRINITY_DN2743_c0_g1_i1:485-1312(+)